MSLGRRLLLVLVFGMTASIASADPASQVRPPVLRSQLLPPPNTYPIQVVLADIPLPRLELPPALYDQVAPATVVPNSRPAPRPRLVVIEGLQLEKGPNPRMIILHFPRQRAKELGPVTSNR